MAGENLREIACVPQQRVNDAVSHVVFDPLLELIWTASSTVRLLPFLQVSRRRRISLTCKKTMLVLVLVLLLLSSCVLLFFALFSSLSNCAFFGMLMSRSVTRNQQKGFIVCFLIDDEQGSLHSYLCPSLEKYTVFGAHSTAVIGLLAAAEGIVSLSSSCVRMHTRGGLSILNFRQFCQPEKKLQVTSPVLFSIQILL